MGPSAAAGHHAPQLRVAAHHVAAPAAMLVLLAAVQPHPAVAVEPLAIAVAVPLAVVGTSEEVADS